MSTAEHDDDAQVENDPTGVRALLSSLPDPGPMPDTVFARISASLQEEQERREQQSAFGPTSGPDVISLAAERHRRRPMRTLTYLGAAAGLAVVATVVSTQVFGPGDGGGSGISADVGNSNSRDQEGGVQADVGAADEGAADGSTAAEGDEGAMAEPPPLGAADEDDAAAPTMGAAGGDQAGRGLTLGFASGEVALSSTDFAADVSRWYSASPVTESGSASVLAGCAQALGNAVPDDATLVLTEGSLDGDPVVLALQTEPNRIAWALDPSCSTGEGEILQGPSVIP
ncbi:hypothetical protein [Ornithinicoccus hortensis]|uniref:Uncharacterized protein n=1 Tax=Ornithinicoccus hortensis TaxID=82346 RepID=A0A542YN17_9MICO|nr:hypothetical protein [Ornithinicoccus hortensis]TQL49429.1 hypothetical protein FB467_0499 [Ornithinicoccus hortensis]